MGLTVTGAAGELKWGFRTAATLRAWTIVKDEQGVWSLTGTLAEIDTFAVSQRPLRFVAPNGWQWVISELQMADAQLHAVLGPRVKYGQTMPVCTA